MTAFVDGLLVWAALAVSAAYLLLTLGPKAWRRRWREGLDVLAARSPAVFGVSALLRRLAGGGKAGCGGCASCADAPTPAASAIPAAPDEVRVPLGRIGRRSSG